jgi:hypothetical protein
MPFQPVPHLKLETATLTTGFLPKEICHSPGVRRIDGALKHRRVSKRAIELDKHLITFTRAPRVQETPHADKKSTIAIGSNRPVPTATHLIRLFVTQASMKEKSLGFP